jgi:hypothetical protein
MFMLIQEVNFGQSCVASFENRLKLGSRSASRVCELRVFYATYVRLINDVQEPRYGRPVT